jgi:hypothetical protein
MKIKGAYNGCGDAPIIALISGLQQMRFLWILFASVKNTGVHFEANLNQDCRAGDEIALNERVDPHACDGFGSRKEDFSWLKSSLPSVRAVPLRFVKTKVAE